jgi:cathepsin B
MRILITLLVLSIALCQVHENEALITPEYIENLKSKASWSVYDYENHPFKGYTTQQLKGMLGLRKNPDYIPKEIDFSLSTNLNLPREFDARIQWPSCIHPIRDQGQCGSCWAFAASEVLSDRFCIASNGAVNVVLSPQDLVSCDTSEFGCDGGYLNRSWDYLVGNGLVTEECLPYTSGQGKVDVCPKSGFCKNGTWKKYKATKYYDFKTVEDIKLSLFNQGPVETGFDVYDDFMNYKSGVYVRSTNKYLGAHAVKVIGWGIHDNTLEHWIVANSWGTAWGEQGYFRIRFNECNFELLMISGNPLISNQKYLQ